MKCYNHPEIDAVAICKSCSKGICKECVIEAGISISCKGDCYERVLKLDNLVAQSQRVSRNSKHVKKNGYAQFAFMSILGLTFATLGFSQNEMFTKVMGLTFVGYSIYVLYRTITYPEVDKSFMADEDKD